VSQPIAGLLAVLVLTLLSPVLFDLLTPLIGR
jgi:hypothetical protein